MEFFLNLGLIHLGLLVSGSDEEQLNVDEKIVKCRTSLFSLLGPAYSYKCLLSPTVQIHLWRTCNLPRLISGLAALPIRPAQAKALETFHKKILRGFLKLSKASPIPALYFLFGETTHDSLSILDNRPIITCELQGPLRGVFRTRDVNQGMIWGLLRLIFFCDIIYCPQPTLKLPP